MSEQYPTTTGNTYEAGPGGEEVEQLRNQIENLEMRLDIETKKNRSLKDGIRTAVATFAALGVIGSVGTAVAVNRHRRNDLENNLKIAHEYYDKGVEDAPIIAAYSRQSEIDDRDEGTTAPAPDGIAPAATDPNGMAYWNNLYASTDAAVES